MKYKKSNCDDRLLIDWISYSLNTVDAAELFAYIIKIIDKKNIALDTKLFEYTLY